MGSFSDYLEAKLLDHVVGKTSFTMPSTVYVALYTTAPNDASTAGTPSPGVEVTGGSYARKSTAGADWNAAASGSISNANTITFVTATGSWGTVLAFALVDSASGAGNILAWGTLGTSKTIGTGDTASFAGGTPGSLVLTLD